MSLLRRVYDWSLEQAHRPYAFWVLGLVSFLESSISPIPPDPMFIPMVLAQRQKAWRLATWLTFTSVIGGVGGYAIGFYLFQSIGQSILDAYHLEAQFERLQTLFQEWGTWIIIAKGLTPIPFKVVTITAGVVQFPFWPFMGASVLCRGMRFFLEAFVVWKYGPAFQPVLEKHLSTCFWALVIALIGGFLVLRYV